MHNLVLLCRRHHRLVHEGGYGIQTASGGITFTLRDGRVLPNNRHGRFCGSVGALKSLNHDNGIEIPQDTAVPELDGMYMDYDLAVLGLVQRE
jgi:hypothetical protein